MSNVIARVRLAMGRVGFYDPLSNVHLTVSRPEADIIAGTNVTGIKRAVHNKTLRLVFGSLEVEAPKGKVVDKTVHAKAEEKVEAKPKVEVKAEPVVAPVEEVKTEPVAEAKVEEKAEEPVAEEKPAAKKSSRKKPAAKAVAEEVTEEAQADAEVTE